MIYASGDRGWNQAVSLVGEAFSQKYPDILVELRPSTKTPGDFYDDFLRKEAAVGELGDVVEIKNINTAIEYHMFVPLPKELTDLVEDKWTASDGEVYTIPFFKLEQGMIYNKNVFRVIGAKPPKTWQEFEALCEKLKAKDYMPLVIGGR